MRHSLLLIIFLLVWLSPKGATSQSLQFADISKSAHVNLWGTNSGVAFADFDADGDQDIYVSCLNEEPNLLFRNNGDGTFTEMAEACGVRYAGATLTSVFGDINNDGFPDLYLGNSREANTLYLNNGDGTFTDITASAFVGDLHQARSVNMADVNGDGYLDIYVANIAAENKLYLNLGDNSFVDITAVSGAKDSKISMGAIFFDYDNDGDPDLYLTHDAKQPNILYQNDGQGNFTDVSIASGADYAGYGMGVDAGDYNNDGWLDLYITNLNENALLRNNGDGTFTELGATAGVNDLGMGWGTAWFDYDNDGFMDLYMVNDSDFSDFANILYHNNGDGTFSDVSRESPLLSNYGAYGTAVADINSDGLIDVFVANKSSRYNELFRNDTQGNHWLSLRLIGTQSNADAVGARVSLYDGEALLAMDEVHAGSGYAGQNELRLHFGLGTKTSVGRMVIRWPSGMEETYTTLDADFFYTATEAEGLVKKETINPGEQPPVVTGNDRNTWKNEGFLLYPNPSEGALFLKSAAPSTGNYTLTLRDISGKRLRSLSAFLNQSETIDLSGLIQDLPQGYYRLQIKGQDDLATLPLIIR